MQQAINLCIDRLIKLLKLIAFELGVVMLVTQYIQSPADAFIYWHISGFCLTLWMLFYANFLILYINKIKVKILKYQTRL